MAASKIMIIRHAEKPLDKDTPPYGITSDGECCFESLIPRGWQRAGALAAFFDPSNHLPANGLKVPQYLYASGIAKHSSSRRPQETITPLAQKLGLDINVSFVKDGEKNGKTKEVAACFKELAEDAKGKDGVVLICWEHQDIPLIAKAIMNDTDNASVPEPWPGDRFDLVWVFDKTDGGDYSFSQVPQQLLYGDTDTCIK